MPDLSTILGTLGKGILQSKGMAGGLGGLSQMGGQMPGMGGLLQMLLGGGGHGQGNEQGQALGQQPDVLNGQNQHDWLSSIFPQLSGRAGPYDNYLGGG